MKLKKAILLLMTLSIASCQTLEQTQAPPQTSVNRAGVSQTVLTASQTGAQVAATLTANYSNDRPTCGTLAAFDCSGVVLRGTVPSPDYFSWNPSPTSQLSGGVSSSYLRKDSKFSRLAYGMTNGFIVAPLAEVLPGKIQLKPLCSFPIDGWTHHREKPGCGAYPDHPNQSRSCEIIGIDTAEKWMTHWASAPGPYPSTYQCGFNVVKATPAADRFYQTIRARNMLGAAWFGEQNELVLETWPQNIPKQLPIMAFFYITTGLAGAQHDQRAFFDQTGDVVPVIRVALPSSQETDATFEFIQKDQMNPGCDPTDPENPC